MPYDDDRFTPGFFTTDTPEGEPAAPAASAPARKVFRFSSTPNQSFSSAEDSAETSFLSGVVRNDPRLNPQFAAPAAPASLQTAPASFDSDGEDDEDDTPTSFLNPTQAAAPAKDPEQPVPVPAPPAPAAPLVNAGNASQTKAFQFPRPIAPQPAAGDAGSSPLSLPGQPLTPFEQDALHFDDEDDTPTSCLPPITDAPAVQVPVQQAPVTSASVDAFDDDEEDDTPTSFLNPVCAPDEPAPVSSPADHPSAPEPSAPPALSAMPDPSIEQSGHSAASFASFSAFEDDDEDDMPTSFLPPAPAPAAQGNPSMPDMPSSLCDETPAFGMMASASFSSVSALEDDDEDDMPTSFLNPAPVPTSDHSEPVAPAAERDASVPDRPSALCDKAPAPAMMTSASFSSVSALEDDDEDDMPTSFLSPASGFAGEALADAPVSVEPGSPFDSSFSSYDDDEDDLPTSYIPPAAAAAPALPEDAFTGSHLAEDVSSIEEDEDDLPTSYIGQNDSMVSEPAHLPDLPAENVPSMPAFEDDAASFEPEQDDEDDLPTSYIPPVDTAAAPFGQNDSVFPSATDNRMESFAPVSSFDDDEEDDLPTSYLPSADVSQAQAGVEGDLPVFDEPPYASASFAAFEENEDDIPTSCFSPSSVSSSEPETFQAAADSSSLLPPIPEAAISDSGGDEEADADFASFASDDFDEDDIPTSLPAFAARRPETDDVHEADRPDDFAFTDSPAAGGWSENDPALNPSAFEPSCAAVSLDLEKEESEKPDDEDVIPIDSFDNPLLPDELPSFPPESGAADLSPAEAAEAIAASVVSPAFEALGQLPEDELYAAPLCPGDSSQVSSREDLPQNPLAFASGGFENPFQVEDSAWKPDGLSMPEVPGKSFNPLAKPDSREPDELSDANAPVDFASSAPSFENPFAPASDEQTSRENGPSFANPFAQAEQMPDAPFHTTLTPFDGQPESVSLQDASALSDPFSDSLTGERDNIPAPFAQNPFEESLPASNPSDSPLNAPSPFGTNPFSSTDSVQERSAPSHTPMSNFSSFSNNPFGSRSDSRSSSGSLSNDASASRDELETSVLGGSGCSQPGSSFDNPFATPSQPSFSTPSRSSFDASQSFLGSDDASDDDLPTSVLTPPSAPQNPSSFGNPFASSTPAGSGATFDDGDLPTSVVPGQAAPSYPFGNPFPKGAAASSGFTSDAGSAAPSMDDDELPTSLLGGGGMPNNAFGCMPDDDELPTSLLGSQNTVPAGQSGFSGMSDDDEIPTSLLGSQNTIPAGQSVSGNPLDDDEIPTSLLGSNTATRNGGMINPLDPGRQGGYSADAQTELYMQSGGYGQDGDVLTTVDNGRGLPPIPPGGAVAEEDASTTVMDQRNSMTTPNSGEHSANMPRRGEVMWISKMGKMPAPQPLYLESMENGYVVGISQQAILVGRGRICDWKVASSATSRSVSRQHAWIVFDDDIGWNVQDVSKSGSTLNNAPISVTSRTPLRPGDILQFGQYDHFRIHNS